MSAPQQPNKTPRRTAKKTRQPTQSLPQGKPAVSDNESSQYLDGMNGGDMSGTNGHPKPQFQGKKGHRGMSTTAQDHYQINSASQNIHVPERTKATPIKQAYAGPTFHQSPAASALPMPSFYSKSVPTAGLNPATRLADDSAAEHSDSNLPTQTAQTKRETTPLDFLFEAARNARGTPRAESPGNRSMNLSMRGGSPLARSPAPRDPESVFPFELDGAGAAEGEIGSSFATPYKDRLDALNPTNSTSDGVRGMDEHERRAKSDALKKLLLHSQNQGTQAAMLENHNPFNAKNPQPRIRPTRHHSGPTHQYMPSYPGPTNQPPPSMAMPEFHHSGVYHQSPHRPPSSGLRNVYGPGGDLDPTEMSSDNQVTPPRISTARKNQQPSMPYPQYGSPGPALHSNNHNQRRETRPPPTPQQLEDDLRRVLKLDLMGRG